MNKKTSFISLLLIFILLLPLAVFARPQPPELAGSGSQELFLPITASPRQFDVTPLGGGFDRVTAIAPLGDGRVLVGEVAGRLNLIHPDGSVTLFMDIRDRVFDEGPEEGFYNIALHPDFAANGTFFVSYMGSDGQPDDRRIVIARYQLDSDPNQGNRDSEVRLLTAHQEFPLHNGGALAFHPTDGFLYAGIGDDNLLQVSQQSNTVKGKVIRLDVTTVSNGPARRWLDAEVQTSSEIWSYGLRNPWRIAFDPLTGGLFIADVGNRTWEEINIVPDGWQGMNFGWPCMEGPDVLLDIGDCANPERFFKPVHAYPHDIRCAIVGGVVYRHESDPFGPSRFLFSDVCRPTIEALVSLSNGHTIMYYGELPPSSIGVTTIAGIGSGPIYVGTLAMNAPIYELYLPWQPVTSP